jgi:signal transduction histidine kinase
MSAMRAAVLGAKGSLSIETNRGFGTAVTIVIPKHEALIAPRAAE